MKDIWIKLLKICKEGGQRLTGRNLTTDNLYTGIELARELNSQFKMTLIGTLRRNKRGVPKSLFNVAGKEQFSSTIWYEMKDSNQARIHLTEYTVVNKSRGKRNIVILSTMIPYRGISKDSRRKPAIFKLYDFTKGGVDVVDQRMANWSTQIKTTKWTVCIFQFQLDCSRVNGCTLFSAACNQDPRLADTKSYLWNLSHLLALPWLYTRNLAPGIQKSVQRNIAITIDNAKQGGIDVEAAKIGEAVPVDEAAQIGEAVPVDEVAHVDEATQVDEAAQVDEATQVDEVDQVGESVQDVGAAQAVEEDHAVQPGLDALEADLADSIFAGPSTGITRKRCVYCLEENSGEGYKKKKQSLPKIYTLCQICNSTTCRSHLKQACEICSKLLVKKDTSE